MQIQLSMTTFFPVFITRRSPMNAKKIRGPRIWRVARGPKTSTGRQGRNPARIPEWQMVFSRIMIAARIVSYIVEYTAPVWHRRHVDSRPRRAIHPPISPYHGHPPRTIPHVRPLNGQAKPPPWCSIIDTYPSRRHAFPGLLRAPWCVSWCSKLRLWNSQENTLDKARNNLKK